MKLTFSKAKAGWMTIVLLILATAMTTYSVAFAAERVYKWTDENGVVHFSASPPPNQETEQIKVKSAPPVQSPEPAQDAPEGELFAEAEQPDNSAVEERNRKAQCQKGRNMIAQIEPRPRVFRVAEDGTRTYLEDDERLDLLAEARDLVAEHCNP